MGTELIESLIERLARIENTLGELVQQRSVKDWYSTEEAARFLGLAEFTVRNYCRLKRIQAEKRRSGRGRFKAWAISHEELLRYQREGLLPEN